MLPSPRKINLINLGMWLCLFTATLPAAQQQGIVKFNALPVPGASVTVSQSNVTLTAITDAQGVFTFPDLAPGTWKLRVEMQLFAPLERELIVPADAAEWNLELLPEDAIKATTVSSTPFQKSEIKEAPPSPAGQQPKPAPAPEVAADLAQRAADGLLINGSVNNGAASPFAQLPAFGNNRKGQRPLYNGSLGLILNNSNFDARPFSITGQSTNKPSYSRIQGLFAFGGPLKIPHLLKRGGPNFTVNYQWTRNSNGSNQTALMPTAAQRAGDLSGMPQTAFDPDSKLPFAANMIPASRISSQAQTLLSLYPLPNFTGSSRYNYQIPIVSGLHQDDLQTRGNKQRKSNFFSANFSLQNTRTDTPNVFGFLNTTRVFGFSGGGTFRHSLSPRSFVNIGYTLSRYSNRGNPFFANRQNISALAGITGNNQEPVNWGPPALSFATGLQPLYDIQASLTRNQTSSISTDAFFIRDRHNFTTGITHRRQQLNVLSQQDPRGTFTFTGAAAGNDVAGFLLGIPDTSSIAYGNADKYLHSSITEAFLNDDWRVNPGLTVNAGIRWEYWSPLTEKYGRLVNLNLPSGFTTASAAVASNASGDIFPHPDRNNFAPRIGLSWRPLSASSLLIRTGYGIYYDTSVYSPIAMQMAQQTPLSTTLRIPNTPETPLTLANGFPLSAVRTALPTFGVDPGFRIGYSQNWQLSMQRDLPMGLQIVSTYAGGKGTRAQQQFLPNTFPSPETNPCLSCPVGFTYLASNGNSIRHSGAVQLRRRLRSGFSADATYTYAKSIDNASLGGRGQSQPLIAQNWLDLRSERALSNFDQRHLLSANFQFTSGMGLRGGVLSDGWVGRFVKEWTLSTLITRGTGLPLTPIYLAAVGGTGVTGSIRPDFTSNSIYSPPPGFFLNPAALSIPAAGKWGNAGRNSITGPGQFTVNAALGRTFRSSDRFSFDLRIEAANAINNVTYPSWNTTFGSAQFGLPNTANQMRTLQVILRSRF